jgi:alpha/beta superfamily hydrolase
VSDALSIAARDGVKLEAKLDEPAAPGGVLVFCHPHPQMGGTMNAPLLATVTEDLVRRGWAVLRFNFRGIGASEGRSGTGLDEVADAAGALAEARARYELPIAIAGWSFGGAVAIRAAAEDGGLDACAVIAPAVTEVEGVTAGLPAPEGLALGAPVLVVCGANDDHVDPAACADWAARAGATFVEVPGANHFFWARYDVLAATVGGFLDAIL